METRANHVLIGAFALAASVLAVLFAIWLGRYEFDVRYAEYDIVFSGGVGGLKEGADVQYSGIKIGTVTGVALETDNPDNVRVRIRVEATTPVNDASKATLETGLLTGISYVQLSGGSGAARRLQTPPGRDVPEIPSMRTGFQELFTGAPDLIREGDRLLKRFNQVLSQENMDAINGIVQDVKTMTGTFASASTNIDNIIRNVDEISVQLKAASQRLDAIAKNVEDVTRNANTIVATDAREVLAAAESAVRTFETLAAETAALVKENRPAIRDFARGGLPQIVLFTQEARELFASLDRLAAKIESDPGQFLFGSGPAAYEPGQVIDISPTSPRQGSRR